jgi:hypothetical protein
MRMSLNSLSCFVLGVALASCAVTAFAQQDETPPGSMPSQGQAPNVHMTHTSKTNAMVNMHGMHTMPATVTSTDPKTGIVKVTAEGMDLIVHFPPASMTTLKEGDKIGLYMAFSQADVVQ